MTQFINAQGQILTVVNGRVSAKNAAGVSVSLANLHRNIGLGTSERSKAVAAAALVGLNALNAVAMTTFRAF